MILVGNTPAGSMARIYLPAVSADEIIEMARKSYISPKLARVDDHTLECPVGGVTYIPIPPGSAVSYPGLLTVDLPAGGRKGQVFRLVVRPFTPARGAGPPGGNLFPSPARTPPHWHQRRGTV